MTSPHSTSESSKTELATTRREAGERIDDRGGEPFRLLVKREDPLRFLVRPKYVAYLRNRG